MGGWCYLRREDWVWEDGATRGVRIGYGRIVPLEA